MSGPTVSTIKRLFALSGNTCAFPKCRQPLYKDGVLIGEMCHIKGEKPGAARYDPSQGDAERCAFANIILMCANHHTIIDRDETTYTVQRLVEMKRTHEASQTIRFAISDAEATRLAIFSGGTVVGAVAGTISGSIDDIVKALSEIAPTKREKSEVLALPKLLKRVGPGQMAFYSDHELGKAIGRQFVSMFATERWQLVEMEQAPHNFPSQLPSNTVLIIVWHGHDAAFEIVAAILDAYLDSAGFKRVEHTKWQQTAGALHVVLAYARHFEPRHEPKLQ